MKKKGKSFNRIPDYKLMSSTDRSLKRNSMDKVVRLVLIAILWIGCLGALALATYSMYHHFKSEKHNKERQNQDER